MNEIKQITSTEEVNPIVQCIADVRCYVDDDGVAQLNLEDVSRGLGFTTVAASGNVVVRWNTVHKYLCGFGVATSCNGTYREMCPEYIPEPIFYLLSMKAENGTARAFQHTIAYDVLPAIRKHGAYMTAQTIEQVLTDPDTIIRLATDLKAEREEKHALEAKVEQDRPKVLFADAVNTSHTSILVGELAKLLKQNGVDIGQNRLFDWMRNNGYLISRKGTDYNMPTQKSMELSLFEVKERTIAEPNGTTSIKKTPKVTGKGQQYFINKFLSGEGAAV